MKSNEFVTLCTFPYASMAEMAKWSMEQAGFEVFVEDDNIVTTDWLLGNAVGGVKLNVRKEDQDRAMSFLQEHPELTKTHFLKKKDNAEAEETSQISCLNCGSGMTEEDEKCPECGWTYQDDSAEDTQ